MQQPRQIVAVAGVGDVGKYLCEELLESECFDVVVISRSQKPWCSSRGIPVYETDYKNSSSLSDLLDSVNAIALISFIQLVDETYVTIHESLITACRQSRSCKRFIPSEWIGNIDDFPQKPQFYYDSREPIRRRLRDTEDLQWTLVQLGFFMDYFLKSNKTYLRPIPDEFPVDPNGLKACIRGTGDEMQTFTLARDVAKAVVQLLMADTWETVTYVAGEWMTYNNAVEIMNEFYSPPLPFLETFSPFHGRPLERSTISYEHIQENLAKHGSKTDFDKWVISQVDEYQVLGGSALPKEKTLRQKEKYFGSLTPLGLRKALARAEEVAFL